jgi:hypothetical protein
MGNGDTDHHVEIQLSNFLEKAGRELPNGD